MAESIKETKEVISASLDLTAIFIKVLKDGVQITDAMQLFSLIMADENLKAEVVAAAQGVSKIPSEVKDLDLQEGLDLAALVLGKIPAIVAATKA